MSSEFQNADDTEINRFHALVSANVKRIRQESEMSQMELALEIGIKSVAFFSNAESNRYGKHFNLSHIYKIAKATNRDIRDFFEGCKTK